MSLTLSAIGIFVTKKYYEITYDGLQMIQKICQRLGNTISMSCVGFEHRLKKQLHMDSAIEGKLKLKLR